jgi:hypothetical protein
MGLLASDYANSHPLPQVYAILLSPGLKGCRSGSNSQTTYKFYSFFVDSLLSDFSVESSQSPSLSVQFGSVMNLHLLSLISPYR